MTWMTFSLCSLTLDWTVIIVINNVYYSSGQMPQAGSGPCVLVPGSSCFLSTMGVTGSLWSRMESVLECLGKGKVGHVSWLNTARFFWPRLPVNFAGIKPVSVLTSCTGSSHLPQSALRHAAVHTLSIAGIHAPSGYSSQCHCLLLWTAQGYWHG